MPILAGRNRRPKFWFGWVIEMNAIGQRTLTRLTGEAKLDVDNLEAVVTTRTTVDGREVKSTKKVTLVAAFQVQYIEQRDMENLRDEVLARQVVDPNSAKSLMPDRDELHVMLLRKTILDWRLPVGSLPEFRATMDLRDLDPKTLIPYCEDELKEVARYSMIPQVIEGLLNDYRAWFPQDRAQEGNSPSGLSLSTASSPATPAFDSP